MLW
ncbi:hypothetical protein CP04DC42_1100A, partial [Chlamydia psittaci 04DC42]|jgi:hypothetical protein